jgi:hypothetical protein
MRGNPLVNLAAILVMLASVLVGGGYWLINKQEQSREILQLPEKKSNMNNNFESLHKRTE